LTDLSEPITEGSPTNGSAVDRIVGAIGPRMRELRLQRGLSLQQLAERAGVSAAAIHKIERNGMVPTITTLLKLADAFDRPVGWFVDEEGPAAGPVAFTPAGGRPPAFSPQPGVEMATVTGSYARFLLDGSVATVAPGAGSGVGEGERQGEELVFVLDGALEFDVDGRAFRLTEGDALHLRTDRPHQWENAGAVRARALWVSVRPL
jgi:DNA-binding XRE family transcriptional regulator/quercetin dioxygenase-like cupin family protein